jgi:hypothetical protein
MYITKLHFGPLIASRSIGYTLLYGDYGVHGFSCPYGKSGTTIRKDFKNIYKKVIARGNMRQQNSKYMQAI